MKKDLLPKIMWCAGLLFLLSIGTVNAFDIERMHLRVKTFSVDSFLEIVLLGAFNKPAVAEPGETLFAFQVIENHPKEHRVHTFNNQEYRFLSRTGEKTFELEHYGKSSGDNRYNLTQKLPVFFAVNDLYPLRFYDYSWLFDNKPEWQMSSYLVKCSKTDEVYIKMTKLEGNRLEFQVVLPL